MFVAIPTAMPAPPLSSSTGTFAGSTAGSYSLPSKFGKKSTVSRFISSSSVSAANLVSLHSVYLIAAAGSASIEPKFPCPSIRGSFVEKDCASLTSASYTALSPCGWYFPSTSPTTLAHFRYEEVGFRPRPCMAYSIRRWTGFIPSRASGSARPSMMLRAYCMKLDETSSGSSTTPSFCARRSFACAAMLASEMNPASGS
mmetsp:Transcript_28832/g.68676  ORF Transcript_28832/g.68676 Transcript_28832/m.68676 type:complete len:200 (+) Transcript_28832:975-1574(+)